MEKAYCSLKRMVLLLMVIVTWNAEETSLCNQKFILWKKFTIQQYGALCHTANYVTNYLNENFPDCIRKESWSPNFCDLNLLDYAIRDNMKNILFNNLKWYEDITGLSAAIPYAWDRLTKKPINNSIDQWRMWLEKVLEEGCGHTVHLIWQRPLMILRTFLQLLTCYSLIENWVW